MKNSDVKPGRYKHYKGDVVEVIGTAFHSETLDDFVIYKHITGKRAGELYYWVRPLAMFMDDVEVNGEKTPRFEYVEP